MKASARRLLIESSALLLVTAAVCMPATAQSFTYLTNQGDNTISLVNTSTNTVVATVPVGHQSPCLAVSASVPAPTVAVTPSGAFAYITNCGDNTVSVINTSNNTVVAIVPVGNSPFGVAITPNGAFAYVTNTADNTVSVINTANNTEVGTVAVGNGPFGVAITPNGASAYVVNGGGQSVSVIDIATNTVTATISIGQNNGFVAITPNGAFAYVSVFSGLIDVIDTSSNTVVTTVSTGGAGTNLAFVAITPNGSFAYVAASGKNVVYVVSTATNTVSATIPVGNFPVGVAITQNGTLAYVANQNDNTVSVINTGTNTVVTTIPVGTKPYGVAVAPGDDDSQFALLNGNNTFNGNQTMNGTLSATNFVGNGSGLTGVSAATANTANFAANAAQLGGVAAGRYARLDIANTFNGNEIVTGSVNIFGNVSAPIVFANIVSAPFVMASNTSVSGNESTNTLSTTGAVTIGGGTPILEHLSQTPNISVPPIAPNNCATLSPVTFSGASDGDTIALGVKNAMTSGGNLTYFAWVSATNTVTIKVCNPHGTTNSTLTGTIRVDIWKH